MKRSSHIRLVILASAGVFGLAACDNPPQDYRTGGTLEEAVSENFIDETKEQDLGQVITSKEECQKTFTTEECQQNELTAQAEHFASAPKFDARELCEQQYGEGKCSSTQTSNGSVFFPLMMGYMMGRSNSGSAIAQPLYQREDRERRYGGGTYLYSGNRSVGRPTGSLGASTPVRVTGVPTTTFRPASTFTGRSFTSAPSVSRGGFGISAGRAGGSAGS